MMYMSEETISLGDFQKIIYIKNQKSSVRAQKSIICRRQKIAEDKKSKNGKFAQDKKTKTNK